MSQPDLSWTPPVMRAGYAGRGLVYTIIAGFSIWALTQGRGEAGTSGALKSLESSPGGGFLLVLIALGMLAYAIWRAVDAIWDLEDYGTDAKGLIARAGMVVTGLIHLVLGVAAIAILVTPSNGDGEGSKIAEWTGKIMAMPGGVWLVGLAGICTIGAGIYYVHKAWKETYREKLRANEFTRNYNGILKAGVFAQAVIVTLIGVFLTRAALTYQPGEAGGLAKALEWLQTQAFGNVIAVAVCIGLLGFALFLFVNAQYRIIPRIRDDDTETLAEALT